MGNIRLAFCDDADSLAPPPPHLRPPSPPATTPSVIMSTVFLVALLPVLFRCTATTLLQSLGTTVTDDALGSPIVPKEMAPKDVVVLGEESHNVHNMSFVICIARSTPILSPDLLSHASGNGNHVEALRVYLQSRSLSRLKNQFQSGNGMITVNSIEGYPPISLLLGKHVFLSAGDFYLASRSQFLLQHPNFDWFTQYFATISLNSLVPFRHLTKVMYSHSSVKGENLNVC